jgi:hypothetical protein
MKRSIAVKKTAFSLGKRLLVISICVLLVALTACGGTTPPPPATSAAPPVTTTAPPVSIPPTTKPVVVKPPLTGKPTIPGGKLLLSPKDGVEVFANTIQIQLDYSNFYIKPRGTTNNVGEGHINFYIDVDPVPTTAGQPAILPSPLPEGYKGKIYIGDTSMVDQLMGYIWPGIPNGNHTIAVQLVQNDNTPFDPPIWDKATIKVSGPYPSGKSTEIPSTAKPVTSKPTVTSFAPTSGGIGTKIVITGKAFTPPISMVRIGDLQVPPTDYTVDSATQITVTLKSTGGSGKVTVTNSFGYVSSNDTFTFN